MIERNPAEKALRTSAHEIHNRWSARAAVFSPTYKTETRKMMKHFRIQEGGIAESIDGIGQLLVYVAPDDREKSIIRDQFHLDEYDLSSTLDPDEVPRLEASQARTFMIWKLPRSAKVAEVIELGVLSVGLALVEDRLAFVMSEGQISFSSREFRNLNNVGDVLLGFLLHAIHHYVGHLRVIKQLSSELQKKITVSMENRHLLQMFALSESLVYYIDAIEGNSAVLARLRRIGGEIGLDGRQLQLLDEVILENAQAARQANIYSSVISGLMDARGNIVNNNMNVLLKNLTLINIVFLPLNLIA
ncbi:MAG: magnesium transporter CorA family protein, partial [Burkholderiales bacterium]